MSLRQQIEKLVSNEIAKTDPQLRAAFEGRAEFSDDEARVFGLLYTRAVLDGVCLLADEIDALRADLNER